MTNLEQLARIIRAHRDSTTSTGSGNDVVWVQSCSCGHIYKPLTDTRRDEHIAQAILDAGWQAPVPSTDIKQRVDEILANDDTELRHCDEDALYEELAVARLTPEERVHIQRLQDADLGRWYA